MEGGGREVYVTLIYHHLLTKVLILSFILKLSQYGPGATKNPMIKNSHPSIDPFLSHSLSYSHSLFLAISLLLPLYS